MGNEAEPVAACMLVKQHKNGFLCSSGSATVLFAPPAVSMVPVGIL